MPQALRVMQALKAANFSNSQALAVAESIGAARSDPNAACDQDELAEHLDNAGFLGKTSDAIAHALSFCYGSSRFSAPFKDTVEKTQLVRAGLSNAQATAFLAAIDACIISPRGNEVRAPIKLTLTPGQVVMCDFSYLRKPEMQKIRRAIVVSARATNSKGRCTLVPVSKQEANPPSNHHHRFPAGTYWFFHRTEPVWAVCDHVTTVAITRLWQINDANNKPKIPSISDMDLASIKGFLRTSLAL